jgi:hypothetical protein
VWFAVVTPQYCAKMGRDGAWGGNLELQAASLAEGVDVVVYQVD